MIDLTEIDFGMLASIELPGLAPEPPPSLPMRAYVVFDKAIGHALWLTHNPDWPPLPAAHLSLAEFTNMPWDVAQSQSVTADLATLEYREGDLPLIALVAAPPDHVVYPTPHEG
jgi:hypothetical protein